MIKFKADISLFETGMIAAAHAALTGTVAGAEKAIGHFKDDALNLVPKCPRDTGYLAEHHVTGVEVIGKLVKATLSVIDTPYAASLHEGISRWKTAYVYKSPGSGMKWIESKALKFKSVYIRDVLGRFSTALKNALEVLS